ncbi:hypothetical protein ACIBKX_11105 [Streptomyces sp. NPDC050658]|uniref:hypothetical protein n=1 Tax=unclassified Streptomyces TaxID=2593676 RepID=UPI003449DCC8
MRKRLGVLGGAFLITLTVAGTGSATAATAGSSATYATTRGTTQTMGEATTQATTTAVESAESASSAARLRRVYAGSGPIWVCHVAGMRYVANGQAVKYQCVGYAPYMAMLYLYVR